MAVAAAEASARTAISSASLNLRSGASSVTYRVPNANPGW